MQKRAIVIYTFCAVIIFSWWVMAFKQPVAGEFYLNHSQSTSCDTNTFAITDTLSISLDRKKIKHALEGDVSTITTLIQQWDIDAELLQQQGYKNISRLPREKFLKSQVLGRLLLEHSEQIEGIQEDYRSKLLIDDAGTPHDLTTAFDRFVPQTYFASGVLLALLDSQHIVAIPEGLRNQTAIYPENLTAPIELDLNRYNMEKLFLSRPQVALVAKNYSHPTALNLLRQQGVSLFTVKEVKTIADLTGAVSDIGHLVNKPLKGDLLSLFIESAFLAIDNYRFARIANTECAPKTLVINYHSQFSLLGPQTFTHHLLTLLGIDNSQLFDQEGFGDGWLLPVTEEQIVQYNPDNLIVIAFKQPKLLAKLYNNAAIQRTNACKAQRILLLDEELQKTESQYCVLAYYDLVEAILSGYEN